jgi:hypothetical protein
MLIRKGNGNGKPNSKNLAIQVTGFTKSSDGAMGVVGTRIPGGERVEAFLTTRGHFASNPERNSIEKLVSGFKMGRNFYKLEEGGIVVFKGAFKPNGGEAYIAQWPNVLAYNAEDAQKYARSVEYGVLRMFQDQNTGMHRGTFYAYQAQDLYAGRAPNGDGLAKGTSSFYAQHPNASFLIRGLDSDGKVIGFRQVSKFFTDDGDGATRAMSADEACATVREAAAQMNAPGGYSVLPAIRWPVTRKGLVANEAGRSSLAFFLAAERAYVNEVDDGQEISAKRSFLKTSEPLDNGIVYVNGVYAEDPYGPGVDPLLIGGLEPSAKLAETTVAHESGHEEPQGADEPDARELDDYFGGEASAPRA